MSLFVVASTYVWSEYPGLRPGRLYAGKPDLFKRPGGESHLVAGPDATETLCGMAREGFPHDFGDPDSISSDRSTRCTVCRDAAAP